MRVNKTVLVGVIVFLLGTTAGAAGGYALGKKTSKSETTKQLNTTNTTQKKNLFNGDELTLVEMYDSLQSSSGEVFDQKMLVYLLSIYNNESGMLRQAETKAQHPELKELAKVLRGKNDQAIPLMNKWQKSWGYSHH
jgi:uncharacterized protein (DUF305 family)